MNNEEILNLRGHFTWDFGSRFFIETSKGNFVWHDPEYGGDNTLSQTRRTFHRWIGNSFGRDKGEHSIRDYCGPDVKIV